ncbi:hypothetical protein [Alkalilimnicola sp. S0819]|uniref:hypothetical protein n=1 Tax=Alkalilimnicola sp. S0819 TaxID=2613922 RepID=UPI0012623172|nr:hypothetical protein [Alkalilimnicola sp. S0819]KAB7624338.1 hypothetical protein F3N43_05890 [Alkalilimnicola sp. S0819]MPQ16163.1 hypothetical protein [Alkalilimnicola sp. S0819]
MLSNEAVANWRLALDVLQVAATLLAFAAAWWVRKTSANRTAINGVHKEMRATGLKLSGRIEGVERRITVAEKEMEHLPNKHDMDDLDRRFDELNRQVAGLAEAHRGTNHLLTVIHQHLLNNGSKAG